jgi:hypothetical protein
MQWWNEFVDWFTSDEGWRVISSAIIPFLAIVIAGFVAALVGRTGIRRLLTVNDRELRAAAVTAMIGSARRAAVWNTLSVSEQRHADHAALEADIRLRLLPATGVGLACDWCAHEIAMMKKNAVSFSFQAEQSLMEFRSRLIDWHTRPSRAKKLFKNDLDTWAYESSLADQDLVTQQKAWAAQQASTPAAADEPASHAQAGTRQVPPHAIARPAESLKAPAFPAAATPPAPVSVPTVVAEPAPIAAPIAAPPVVAPAVVAPAPAASGDTVGEPITTAPAVSSAFTATAAIPTQTAPPFARFTPGQATFRPVTSVSTPNETEASSAQATAAADESFPPVTAARVRDRINPPTTDDDELR